MTMTTTLPAAAPTRPSLGDTTDGVDPAHLDGVDWSLWGMRARLVTDRALLADAKALADRRLAEVELAISRFRDDSELAALTRAARDTDLTTTVSPLFAEILRAALDAARRTEGAVDPSVGADLVRWGYDRDIADIPAANPTPGSRATATSWRDIRLDGDALQVPAGTVLDLGAVGKAWAADDLARAIEARLGTSALVCLGGDVAAAGPAPRGGWVVDVGDDRDGSDPTQPQARISVEGGGIATSSTLHRTWRAGSASVSHIIDPRTGDPAPPRWRTVSVHAASAAQANAAATATMVHGVMGLWWLRQTGLDARVVDRSGRVHHLGGWPAGGERS